MNLDELNKTIKEIEQQLVGEKKLAFMRCVQKLQYPNLRPWPISEDSLSGVQRSDQDCKNCIESSGQYKEKIKECIEGLLEEYRRN